MTWASLINATIWAIGRDTELGQQFNTTNFFGSTQFMAHCYLVITEAREVEDGKICVEASTTIKRIEASYLQTVSVENTVVVYEKAAELSASYLADRCGAFAGRGLNLAILGLTEIDNP